MEVSSAFVVVMGMGVTFVGLSCIIFLTLLMGKILSRPEPPKAEPVVPAAPAVPADGLTDEVKVAIMAAIAVATASAEAKGTLSGKRLYAITPTSAEMTCPPTRFLGCDNSPIGTP